MRGKMSNLMDRIRTGRKKARARRAIVGGLLGTGGVLIAAPAIAGQLKTDHVYEVTEEGLKRDISRTHLEGVLGANQIDCSCEDDQILPEGVDPKKIVWYDTNGNGNADCAEVDGDQYSVNGSGYIDFNQPLTDRATQGPTVSFDMQSEQGNPNAKFALTYSSDAGGAWIITNADPEGERTTDFGAWINPTETLTLAADYLTNGDGEMTSNFGGVLVRGQPVVGNFSVDGDLSFFYQTEDGDLTLDDHVSAWAGVTHSEQIVTPTDTTNQSWAVAYGREPGEDRSKDHALTFVNYPDFGLATISNWGEDGYWSKGWVTTNPSGFFGIMPIVASEQVTKVPFKAYKTEHKAADGFQVVYVAEGNEAEDNHSLAVRPGYVLNMGDAMVGASLGTRTEWQDGNPETGLSAVTAFKLPVWGSTTLSGEGKWDQLDKSGSVQAGLEYTF